MIKLKNILKEISDDLVYNDAYSWQGPDGKFIPVKHSHEYDASQILLKKKIKLEDRKAELMLQRMGWQRINSGSVHTIYCSNNVQPPTERQKRNLIDLALQFDFEKIICVSDEMRLKKSGKIIWSKDDVLESLLSPKACQNSYNEI